MSTTDLNLSEHGAGRLPATPLGARLRSLRASQFELLHLLDLVNAYLEALPHLADAPRADQSDQPTDRTDEG
jgi:hypothetical protein